MRKKRSRFFRMLASVSGMWPADPSDESRIAEFVL
jgi:hypothetical protein